MKRLLNSSTVPERCSMADSPMGLSVNGGPKRATTSWTNYIRAAAVELHAVEPKLGVVKQVESRECYLVVRCSVHIEEPLTAIQPRQGVVETIELRKFHLVGMA
jgi:hypothetical protein